MKITHFIAIFCLFCGSIATTEAQIIHYVNQKATGNQSGTSWQNAFVRVQDALAAAAYGDEIWVARGTYKPTESKDPNMSFVLQNGVALYGGFQATETLRDQRNPLLNPTVLSGAIGDSTDRRDNTLHVLRGAGLDANTVLDGFTISDGYAYGLYNQNLPITGAGLLLESGSGASETKLQIRNCIFENNRATSGGAIGIWSTADTTGEVVNPSIRDCIFRNNLAQLDGGAIYRFGSTHMDTFRLSGCRFVDNRAEVNSGGGISIFEPGFSAISFEKCTFERDSSLIGGGIYIKASDIPESSLSVLVDSCLFFKNHSLDGSGFCYNGYLHFIYNLKLTFIMRNSVFEDNIAVSGDSPAFAIYTAHYSELAVDVLNCDFLKNKSPAGYYTTRIWVVEGCKAIVNFHNNRFIRNSDNPTNTSNQFPIFVNATQSLFAPNTVTTKITNCLFERNGGGVIVLATPNNKIDTEVANCTFFKNYYPQFVCNSWDSLIGDSYLNFRIRNSIIWEPGTNIWSMFYSNDKDNPNMYSFDIDYSAISLAGPLGPPGSFQAFGDNMIYKVEPGFVDSSGGDFRLLPCSPLRNAGNNDVAEDLGILTDLDGAPRIRFDTVDLGAFEIQDTCGIVHTNDLGGQSVSRTLDIWNNPSGTGYLVFRNPVGSYESAVLSVYSAGAVKALETTIRLEETNSIYLGELQGGYYTVRLQSGAAVFTGKFILLD